MILTFMLLTLCLSQGYSLDNGTAAAVPVGCANFVDVRPLTASVNPIAGSYSPIGGKQHNFYIYLMAGNFQNRMEVVGTLVSRIHVIVFNISGRKFGFLLYTIPPIPQNGKCFPSGFDRVFNVHDATNSSSILGQVRLTDPAAPLSVPATFVPTTVAPNTTLPCPTRENVVPFLKTLSPYKKIKTATVCKDMCIELEGCQYWVWRNSKKVARRQKNKYKRQCRLYAVDWKKSMNTVAGEIC